MINPHMLEPGYTSWKSQATGRKFYLVAFMAGKQRIMGRRRPFKTATQAETYARRVLGRWCRLYDAFMQLPEDVKARVRPEVLPMSENLPAVEGSEP